jgi:Dna[CI] antecedent, DciA
MLWSRNDSHPVAGIPVATFEREFGNAGFIKVAEAFIAVHSAPVALREGILYVRVLQPALHYELEQISKSEILRKLKQRFGVKTIRDVRFRVG